MKILGLIIGVSFSLNGLTQAQSVTTYSNATCETAIPICNDLNQTVLYQSGQTIYYDCGTSTDYYYSFTYNASPNANISFSTPNSVSGTYVVYGPVQGGIIDQCNAVYSNNVIETGSLSSTTTTVNVTGGASYILKITTTNCSPVNANGDRGVKLSISLVNNEIIACHQEFPCENCVSSFTPSPGEYMVSAWVKESGADPYTTTYSNSEIKISFTGDPTTATLTPSGKIIDGWQRIEGRIVVPSAATDISITLNALNGASCYYDDIRFYPFDGSMMSYVYDPQSLRLMAELDERNYATLYEYDEEGKLIRVKKETERGIMTIQENRDNIKKQE